MNLDTGRYVESALPPLRISWYFMVFASLAWAGLGMFASPAGLTSDPTTARKLTVVLATIGALCAVAALWIDRAVITTERMAALIPVFDYALVQRHLLAGHLVLWSLAQLPALFGFAQLLLDGSLGMHLALCAVSLATLAILMPTRARITARMTAVLR
ncbi:MAG: hypothetical protein ACYC9Y_01435 [Candidatus Methylomirabilia bacterium]